MLSDKRDFIRGYCEEKACIDCEYDVQDSWCDKCSVMTAPDDVIVKVYDELTKTEDDTPDNTVEEVKHDVVNHPDHYCHGGMECIDEMVVLFGREAVKHFCLCNAWKYRKRAMFKNGEEDMKKSDWYIAKYKELTDGTIQTF